MYTGHGGDARTAIRNYRKNKETSEAISLEAYWVKTAGLYPQYDDLDESCTQFDPSATAEYGEAQHELMKHVFDARADETAMKTAAEIIGTRGNVHAMHGCVHVFTHALGMAYQKSGMDGRDASVALAAIRSKMADVWDGVNGFSMYHQHMVSSAEWSES